MDIQQQKTSAFLPAAFRLSAFRPKKAVYLGLFVCLLLLTACASGKDAAMRPDSGPDSGISAGQTSATASPASTASADAAFEDYDNLDNETIADPFETWNRFWFTFNDILLLDIIKPVYKGYVYIVPEEFRSGLSNFLHNLQMPIRFANSLLQGEFAQAGVEMGRFIVNSTLGFGGLFDVTKDKKVLVPINPREADFGQTLAVWGVGEGFYLVWPLIGPSTARDSVGLAGDYFASPFFWGVEPVGPVDFWAALGTNSGLRFNNMGNVIDTYETLTKGAIEPYIAARDAYVKYRRAGVLRGRAFW